MTQRHEEQLSTIEKLERVQRMLAEQIAAQLDRTLIIPNVPYLVSFCEENAISYRVIESLHINDSRGDA